MAAWQRVFADLVRERGQALLAAAYLLCGDRSGAADLVQEALVRAFRRVRAGHDVEHVEAYVRKAMVGVYLDEHRRVRRWAGRRHLVAAEGVDGDPAGRVDDRVVVGDALAGLSPRQRACVVLRFYADLPVADIAGALGCAEGTVKRHISDALARLEPSLRADGRER